MNTYYAMIALDLANDRSRELEEKRLVRLARLARPRARRNTTGSQARSRLQRSSRARSRDRRDQPRAAAATRRLDDNVAEDLGLASGLSTATFCIPTPSSACPSRQALFEFVVARARPSTRRDSRSRYSGPTHPLPASSGRNRDWQAREPDRADQRSDFRLENVRGSRTGGYAAPVTSTASTTAVSWGTDRIDLFTVAPDRSLVHRSFDGDRWSEPTSLGGRLASAPAATAWGVDELQVFAIFDDGQLWNRYWDGTSWHEWEPWAAS